MMNSVLIDLQHISKVFPPATVALSDVSVSFRSGEIHALVGENGAGKTTLMKVLYGLERRDRGDILLRGTHVDFRNPREAIAAGIGMVHQEILLIPEYTIWQNVVLGAEPVHALGALDIRTARERVARKIDEFQFNLDPDAPVGSISVAARQKVEILKLLYRDVSVLILDEPTAVLAPQEVGQLFLELQHLRDKGHTIIFISHRLDEVLGLSDQVTVMRRGKAVATSPASRLTKEELARQMVGRSVVFAAERSPAEPGEPVLVAQGLTVRTTDGRDALDQVSLQVRSGEILGVAGVEGNGQFELVNAIMGLSTIAAGSLFVQGIDLSHADILTRRRFISFVPQDRGRMGASLPASILENAIMTHHILDRSFRRWRGLALNYRRAIALTRQIQHQFDVSMENAAAPFQSLSGGNQQKVILGRELLLEAPLVLMDQPTRGLDVGSTEYVHGLLLDLRNRKKAVLLVSADLDEVFTVADRIIVMSRGQLVADLRTEETTREEVGYYMLGGKDAVHAQADI